MGEHVARGIAPLLRAAVGALLLLLVVAVAATGQDVFLRLDDLVVDPVPVEPGGQVVVIGDGWPTFSDAEGVVPTISVRGSGDQAALEVVDWSVDGGLEATLLVSSAATGSLDVDVCVSGVVEGADRSGQVDDVCAPAHVEVVAPVVDDETVPVEPPDDAPPDELVPEQPPVDQQAPSAPDDGRPWLRWVGGAALGGAVLAAWQGLRGRRPRRPPTPPPSATPEPPPRPAPHPAAPEPGVPPWAGRDVVLRLDVPARVAPGAPIEVAMRLETPAGTLVPIDADLDVQVVADGFTAPAGVVADPVPTAPTHYALPLVADGVDTATTRRVQSFVSWDGHLVGWSRADVEVDPAARAPSGGVATAVAVPLGEPDGPAPDLTVTITRGDDERWLLWTMTSPHPVGRPRGEVRSDLRRTDARTFALGHVLRLGDRAGDATGADLLAMEMDGIAAEIGDRVPVAVWRMLAEVESHVSTRPTVLVVSDETWIPWELAALPPDRHLEPGAPRMLGAHVALGRWIQPDPRGSGVAGPPLLPPPSTLAVHDLAVVVDDSAAGHLPQALEEARWLHDHLDAVVVPAGSDQVGALLAGRLAGGTQDLLHLACHGHVGPSDPSSTGLHLRVGRDHVVLTPHMLRGSPLLHRTGPVLFANACEVGTPQDALDVFGGVVGGALRGGARAVVAPMWQVGDDVAADTAVDVWSSLLSRGEAVGEVLRRRRAAPAEAWRRRDLLSYAYYGHPALRLHREHTEVFTAPVAPAVRAS